MIAQTVIAQVDIMRPGGDFHKRRVVICHPVEAEQIPSDLRQQIPRDDVVILIVVDEEYPDTSPGSCRLLG